MDGTVDKRSGLFSAARNIRVAAVGSYATNIGLEMGRFVLDRVKWRDKLYTYNAKMKAVVGLA